MKTVQKLRSQILSILGPYLGVYTYSTGATMTAVWIHGVPMDEEPARSGLEVVIRPKQNPSMVPMLSGDKRLNHTVLIDLKQWDLDKTTEAARELLIKELPIDRIESWVPRAVPLDIIETCTLAIDDGFYFFG